MPMIEEITTRWRVQRADGKGERVFDTRTEATEYMDFQAFVAWMLDRKARSERLDDALDDDEIWRTWTFQRKEKD